MNRNIHYVAEWYQRGFLQHGQSKLHYFDMSPERKVLPDGRTVTMKSMRTLGPKNCFCEYDLYSTHFGSS